MEATLASHGPRIPQDCPHNWKPSHIYRAQKPCLAIELHPSVATAMALMVLCKSYLEGMLLNPAIPTPEHQCLRSTQPPLANKKLICIDVQHCPVVFKEGNGQSLTGARADGSNHSIMKHCTVELGEASKVICPHQKICNGRLM